MSKKSRAASPSPAPEPLGRFGHHPEPAIDFCVEADAIEGLEADVKASLSERTELESRLSRALTFIVGGDAMAVAAKQRLYDLAERLAPAKKPPCTADDWCPTMDSVLDTTADASERGLVPISVPDAQRGRRLVGVAYKLSHKDRGVMLSRCPWCGTDLLELFGIKP